MPGVGRTATPAGASRSAGGYQLTAALAHLSGSARYGKALRSQIRPHWEPGRRALWTGRCRVVLPLRSSEILRLPAREAPMLKPTR